MNNEDAISRADALDIVRRTCGDYVAAFAEIRRLPSVPPQVSHGQWIKDKSGVIYCSECGEEHAWLDFRATYCDVCGAKMDGEDDTAD